jgi:hypothetical protein
MRAPDEAQLRARFDALRTARTAAAPSLSGLLEAARARRRAAAAAARRRRLLALSLALPLGGALTAYALERSGARTDAQLVAAAGALAAWRSPTHDLLVDPSLAWLSGGATLESMLELPTSYPTGGQP